jgi:8-oxo-dGTP pyrophosphatase MutT (NUDIX family)
MRVYYSDEPLPDETTCSIFLMGPTPRAGRATVESWRPAALRELADLGFRGEVFVPERRDGQRPADYTGQIDWEDAALNRADRLLAWVPRDLTALPGLTTNDEWGFWKGRDPARLVLGTPPGAAHVRYQQEYARRLGVPVVETLVEACASAAADPGEPRRGGECDVPLHVWRTPVFQTWYAAQRAAGNVLHGARVEWVYRAGPRREVLFWALHVDVSVAAEGRRKANEVVIGRPDVAAAVLYRPAKDWPDAEVVLVREYRSPAVTPDGYIWELPGGSVSPTRDPADAAADEVAEETGLRLPRAAFRGHGARQAAGTVTAHRVHVFSAELTADQVAGLRAREAAGTALGLAAETERTYVRVRTVRQVLDDTPADWTTRGIILSVLREHGPEQLGTVQSPCL